MVFSFKSKKICFSALEKKAFCGRERVLCFPFLFVYEASLLQKCKLSGKRRTLLFSPRRSANKFSNWAAFRAGWLFLFKKGISR